MATTLTIDDIDSIIVSKTKRVRIGNRPPVYKTSLLITTVDGDVIDIDLKSDSKAAFYPLKTNNV